MAYTYGGQPDPDHLRLQAYEGVAARSKAKSSPSSESKSNGKSTSSGSGTAANRGIGSCSGSVQKGIDDASNGTASSAANVHFELVGEKELLEELKKFENLINVNLDHMRIFEPGDIKTLQKMSRVKSLSLENNLFNSWKNIGRISSSVGSRNGGLEELRLSQNPLPPLTRAVCADIFGKSLEKLQCLVLHRMQNVLDTVNALSGSKICQRLSEIHMCYNQITSLNHVNLDGLPNLTLVNLEKNMISDFAELRPLALLPKLGELLLGGNHVSVVSGSKLPKNPFPQLKALHLQENWLGLDENGSEMKSEYDTWQSVMSTIESLDAIMPNLTRLRTIRNKGLEKAFGNNLSNVRGWLIGRMPHLQQINLSEVRPKEREAAERAYIKWCDAKAAEEKKNPEIYPHYRSYKKLHGSQLPNENKKPVSMKESMIKVLLTNIMFRFR
uniref:Uncharacterized protein n=1 Tax=Lotharella globosa TaxID=91324 RepID=A0A7S3Z077_9EUKA